jgi:hypothetical protein
MAVTLEQLKAKFNIFYGKDASTRTRKQWLNLVETYGYETIKKTEGLTKEQIKDKCKK